MAIKVEDVLTQMLSAAKTEFGAGWDHIKAFAPAEFKKIAMQLVEIAENVGRFKLDPNDGYSPETGALLLKMQRNATESVLVGVTALTLLAVQNAINAVLKVIKNTFTELAGLIL